MIGRAIVAQREGVKVNHIREKGTTDRKALDRKVLSLSVTNFGYFVADENSFGPWSVLVMMEAAVLVGVRSCAGKVR